MQNLNLITINTLTVCRLLSGNVKTENIFHDGWVFYKHLFSLNMIIYSKWKNENMMLQGLHHSIINYFFLSISLILRLSAPGLPHVRDVRGWVSGLFTSSLAGTCDGELAAATQESKPDQTCHRSYECKHDPLSSLCNKYLLEVLHWFMPSLRWALARSELVCFNWIYGQQ